MPPQPQPPNSPPKPDGKRFVHYGYTSCSLRPTLKRRAQHTKPGKPGSQGASAPFTTEPGALAPGGACANLMHLGLAEIPAEKSGFHSREQEGCGSPNSLKLV